MIRIVADDFAYDKEQDLRIIELADSQALTSISCFVNFKVWASSADLVSGRTVETGLHLNLTDGMPLSAVNEIPTLVSRSGSFASAQFLVNRFLSGNLNRNELKLEIRAQIESFLAKGCRLDHVDSHRHIHRIPTVSRALAETLEELKLQPRIRNLKRLPITYKESDFWNRAFGAMRGMTCLVGNMLKGRTNDYFRRVGCPMDDGLLTPIPLINPSEKNQWISLLGQVPKGQWELNFHPGWSVAEYDLLRAESFISAWSGHK